METFLKEYVEYFKSMGLSLVYQTDPDQHDGTHSLFTISDSMSIFAKKVYLVKVFRVGFLLVEAGVDGGFGYANLYTLNQKTAFSQLSIEKEGGLKNDFRNLSLTTMKLFHEECAKFKNYTHVNSFVYDFHLRYFQSFLVDHKKEFPPLDFLEILRAFVRYNPSPSRFSRNRIIKGESSVKCTLLAPTELFAYTLQHGLFFVVVFVAMFVCFNWWGFFFWMCSFPIWLPQPSVQRNSSFSVLDVDVS